MSDETFRLISALISEYCGLHFELDRVQVVSGKLAPRLEATHCYSFKDYYHLLKYDGAKEIRNAVELLTNHETYFFREVAQLRFVTQLVVGRGGTVRILSAGSSTGEEAYSVAMLLDEAKTTANLDIVGVDISHRVIERARTAAYTANSFRGVDGAVVERYFSTRDGQLHLAPEIRDTVMFDRLNLMESEGVSELGGFDIILCRNVLIYFSRESKARAIANLTEILQPGGYLFLGHAESLFDVPHALEMVRAGSVIAHRRPIAGVA